MKIKSIWLTTTSSPRPLQLVCTPHIGTTAVRYIKVELKENSE